MRCPLTKIGSSVRLTRQSVVVQVKVSPESVALVGDWRVGTISGNREGWSVGMLESWIEPDEEGLEPDEEGLEPDEDEEGPVFVVPVPAVSSPPVKGGRRVLFQILELIAPVFTAPVPSHIGEGLGVR
jgi:hypothetical protein